MPASVSAIAIAMKNRGTQSPSLSPLSTFSPWRIRDGMRASVTTALPSAASVHASTIASTSASVKLIPGITAAPTRAPARIVSGRPIPSSRSGTENSRWSARSEIRDASANSTSVSVISASSLTSSPCR